MSSPLFLTRFCRLWREIGQVKVPPCSLLARAAADAKSAGDAFELHLAVPAIGPGPAPAEDQYDHLPALLARSFFDSPVFRIERAILRFAGIGAPTTSAEIQSMKFASVADDDTVAMWRYAEGTDRDLLFRWASGGYSGGTWFRAERQPGGASVRLVFGSYLHNPLSHMMGRGIGAPGDETRSAGARARLFNSFHLAYSRILLAAAGALFEEALRQAGVDGQL